MRISIMITTHNRLPDLRRTLGILRQLNPPPFEVLITADGCTDGTVQFIRNQHPAARLFVNDIGKGSVASRDRMVRAAEGDLVLSLDDDSYPEQMDCLTKLTILFQEREKLAVAHFPQHTDEYPETLSRTDFGNPRFTRSFANAGACFRRSVYLELPGFEPRFFHMYEEPDYGLQCVAAGFEVYYTPVISIRHHWSSQSRSRLKNHHRHARNQFWSTLMRCPFPQAMLLIAYKSYTQFYFAATQGLSWVIQEPVWWWEAAIGIPYCLRRAKRVSWKGYKRWLDCSSEA